MNLNYLSIIIFLPAVGALLIAWIPGTRAKVIRYIAALSTFVSLVLALIVFAGFDRSSAMAGVMQFEESVNWIPVINASYHVGVDGISLPLFVLMAFLGFLSVLVSWKIDLRPREYFSWLLVLETSILGVFAAQDLLLFFIFWELELIPMYFLISIWGAGRKEYSAIKYVLYTLLGSAMMLAGILAVYFTTGSLDMGQITRSGISSYAPVIPAALMFFLLFGGFAVKLPVFPLHTWLPDAHTDAPTAVSVVLAGTLLKMGGYGMIRICVSFFPDAAQAYAPLLVIFATVNIIYGAAVTLKQTDIKRLIAYSSISHMGFVLLGIFALGKVSMIGAVMQMVSHGLITGLLFATAGIVMHNTHERDISKLGGLARQIPIITVIFTIAGLGAMGVPSTSGFIAEFMVFLGAFSSPAALLIVRVFAGISVLGILLGAGYILWMLQRSFYGPPQDKFNGVADADNLERVYSAVFIALIFLIGLYPAILTRVIETGTEPIIRLIGG
ncbi:MAG: NADH-quinone oxidoreductase subunit M [Dehalococcoidales bacterium]|nr:NADH-quinone oxidoreductase subunit M [Dehalococcoidales bacterium]